MYTDLFGDFSPNTACKEWLVLCAGVLAGFLQPIFRLISIFFERFAGEARSGSRLEVTAVWQVGLEPSLAFDGLLLESG